MGVRIGVRGGLGAAALGLAAAAAAARALEGPGTSPQEPSWTTVSAVAFPEVAREGLAAGAGWPGLAELVGALDRNESPEIATRAAVLLGTMLADETADRELRVLALGALLRHLELRRKAEDRYAISAAVVAARALDETAARDPKVAVQLEELGAGQLPHPDLAVRVECAAVALAAGRRERTVPFLLAVLRAETPDQEKSPRTWERMTTLAWVKTRAAQALSDAAGADLRFRPDGSWAHQMAEADRLEEMLSGR